MHMDRFAQHARCACHMVFRPFAVMSPHFALAEAVRVRDATKAACFEAVEFVSNKNTSNKDIRNSMEGVLLCIVERTIIVCICHQTNNFPGLVGEAAGLDQSEPAWEKQALGRHLFLLTTAAAAVRQFNQNWTTCAHFTNSKEPSFPLLWLWYVRYLVQHCSIFIIV